MGSLSSARALALRSSSSCAVPFAISVLLLLFSSLVVGVDVLYCPQDDCQGNCLACTDLPQVTCCLPGAGVTGVSVDVLNADIDVPANVNFYVNVRCNGNPSRYSTGSGCQPQIGADFTGVLYTTPPPTDFSETDASGPETTWSGRTVMPNAAFFSEPGQTGRWVLPVSNLTDYWSQVKDIPDGETLNWFKSQGATYKEYN